MTRTPKTRAAVPPAARGSAISDADPAGVPSPPCGAPASPFRQAVSQDTAPDGTRASSRATPRTGPRDGTREEAPGTPAGAAHASPREATSAAPDRTTTWTLELPAGMPLPSLNDRDHWRTRHAKAQAVKNAAIVMARKAKLPRLGRVSIVAEHQPPDRRHRDGDNIAPAAKAAVDGLVVAGVLAGDDKRYVTGTYCTIGERYPKGRLVLHVTEVAP